MWIRKEKVKIYYFNLVNGVNVITPTRVKIRWLGYQVNFFISWLDTYCVCLKIAVSSDWLCIDWEKQRENNMQWFTGSIPEAIGESKRKGLLFIVYIEGILVCWTSSYLHFVAQFIHHSSFFAYLPARFNLFNLIAIEFYHKSLGRLSI